MLSDAERDEIYERIVGALMPSVDILREEAAKLATKHNMRASQAFGNEAKQLSECFANAVATLVINASAMGPVVNFHIAAEMSNVISLSIMQAAANPNFTVLKNPETGEPLTPEEQAAVRAQHAERMATVDALVEREKAGTPEN